MTITKKKANTKRAKPNKRTKKTTGNIASVVTKTLHASLVSSAAGAPVQFDGQLEFQNENAPHLFRCFIRDGSQVALLVQDVGAPGVFGLEDVVAAARTLHVFFGKSTGDRARLAGRFHQGPGVDMFIISTVLG